MRLNRLQHLGLEQTGKKALSHDKNNQLYFTTRPNRQHLSADANCYRVLEQFAKKLIHATQDGQYCG
jgi:hypothetical protein